MKHMLRRLDGLLDLIERSVVAVLCCVALILGVMQVVLRYLFNTGFHWNETVFVTLTLWAMLIGGSRAVREGLHARVEIIASILPERGVHVCNLLAMLAACALSALYFYCGYLYVQFVHSMDLRDIDTNVPEAVTYAIVPVAMGLFVVRYVIKLIDWFSDPGEYSRPPEIEQPGGGL